MTDRELLEKAAKAAGIEIVWSKFSSVPALFGEYRPGRKVLDATPDLGAALERETCAKLVEPDDMHRRDALDHTGGDEGVELLDNRAAAIRARGQG